MTSKNRILSIGDAAKECGCSIKQIRHWETKGYIPESQRVVCGVRSYRNYGHDDLRIIKKIVSYLDAGYTLKAAAQRAADDISTLKEDVTNEYSKNITI